MLLWLWHRPAAAAPIQPLAWELPYAVGTALKRQKEKKGVLFLFLFLFLIMAWIFNLYPNILNFLQAKIIVVFFQIYVLGRMHVKP